MDEHTGRGHSESEGLGVNEFGAVSLRSLVLHPRRVEVGSVLEVKGKINENTERGRGKQRRPQEGDRRGYYPKHSGMEGHLSRRHDAMDR